MTEIQGIVKGDAYQQLGSAALIIGVVLWLISSILMFRVVASASSLQEEMKTVAEHVASSQAGELMYALSSLAVMIGVSAVSRSITANVAAAWSRTGFYLFALGTALWIVGYALDIAFAASLAKWLSTPVAGKEAAYGVVAALGATSRGTFPLGLVIYWLAFIPLGIGILRSAIYPGWLGSSALVLGLAGVGLGTFQTFNGRESTFNLFVVLFAFTTLWFLVIGIWVARKAW